MNTKNAALNLRKGAKVKIADLPIGVWDSDYRMVLYTAKSERAFAALERPVFRVAMMMLKHGEQVLVQAGQRQYPAFIDGVTPIQGHFSASIGVSIRQAGPAVRVVRRAKKRAKR